MQEDIFNVHSHYVTRLLTPWIAIAQARFPLSLHVSSLEFQHTMDDIYHKYGDVVKPPLENIMRAYHDGMIMDSQLPNINFAVLLYAIWYWIRKHDSYVWFRDMLLDIGTTCLNGITHRLLLNYIVILDHHESQSI